MKKIYIITRKITVFLLLMLLIIELFACSKKVENNTEVKSNKSAKYKVITTIFPYYDIVKNIIKNTENIEVDFLLDTGVDLHSYNPTAQDLTDIAESDLFIFTGGESEDWIELARKTIKPEKTKFINLMEILPDILIEEDEDEHDHKEEEHEHEFDEHIWLSLVNAGAIIKTINNALCELDIDNKEKYNENTHKYLEEFDKVDQNLKKVLGLKEKKYIVFADRFPFKYMFDDYKIDYLAAFSGCSAESEASFNVIAKLSRAIDAHNLNSVLILEGNNKKIAEAVIKNSEAWIKKREIKIYNMDSLQSITRNDLKHNVSYLDIMKGNADTLIKALD